MNRAMISLFFCWIVETKKKFHLVLFPCWYVLSNISCLLAKQICTWKSFLSSFRQKVLGILMMILHSTKSIGISNGLILLFVHFWEKTFLFFLI